MTSNTYCAQEALRMGLVDKVYGVDSFWSEVVMFAEKVAAYPLAALSASKRLLNAAEDTDLRTGCLLEQETATNINTRHHYIQKR